MQKAGLTGSGRATTQMAHCGGETTTTTTNGTASGSTTTQMAHWCGEPNTTTGFKKGLTYSGTIRAELPVRDII